MRNRHNYSLGLQLLNFGLTTLGVAVLIIAVFVFGPVLETKFFPVYSKFKIVEMERVSDTQTKAVFRFEKLRNCEPHGSSWFFGELGIATRQIHMTVDGNIGIDAVIRPIGVHLSNPYIVDVTPEQLANSAFAEMYNRCHPFWITRTKIFP